MPAASELAGSLAHPPRQLLAVAAYAGERGAGIRLVLHRDPERARSPGQLASSAWLEQTGGAQLARASWSQSPGLLISSVIGYARARLLTMRRLTTTRRRLPVQSLDVNLRRTRSTRSRCQYSAAGRRLLRLTSPVPVDCEVSVSRLAASRRSPSLTMLYRSNTLRVL